MWTFEQPAFLLLLLALPVVIWLRHVWRGRSGLVPFSFAIPAGKRFRPPPSAWRFLLVTAACLFWAGVGSIIVSIAAPTSITRERSFLSQGLEIMLLVDVSPSMAAQDIPGKSRLDQSRATLADFIKKRNNDAIGLVAFGSDASLICPLTQDYGALNDSLNRLEANMFGEGTSIGLGLAVAALHFSPDRTRGKLVVLVSDGDNNAGEITPISAASLLKSSGVRVYSIGLGSDREVYLEYSDKTAGRRISGTFKGVLDEALLRSIADQTAGKYFFAGAGNGLTAVLDSIDSSEQIQSRARVTVIKTPLQNQFLLLGLLLILGDLSLRRLLLREVV